MPGPNWISQTELDSLIALQNDLISEIGGVCTIRRPTRVSDGYGGWTNTFVDQHNIPLRLYIATGSKGQTRMGTIIVGDQEKLLTRSFITFPTDVDIQVEDIVVYDGVDWKIMDIQIPDTFRTAIRCRAVTLS